MNARRLVRAASVTIAFAFAAAAPEPVWATSRPSQVAERAFARTVSPIDAHEITGNLIKYTGTHIKFVCTVTAIVHSDTMIGQCGRANEPVDVYVLAPTAGLHVGMKLRVLGVMMVPSQWTDVTSHTWYTPMVQARFVDRL